MSGFTILAAVLKALKFIWPFIAEMFFAGKSIKQIITENKFSIILLILLLFSIFLNYASFSKIYELAIARRENDPQKKVLEDKVKKDKSVAEEPHPPTSSLQSSAPSQGVDAHEAVRQKLEHIYKSH